MLLLLCSLAHAAPWVHRVVVEIEAPPERVFEVLLHHEGYAEWNPWVLQSEGPFVEGQVLEAVALLGEERRPVKHRVLEIQEPLVFHWEDVGAFTLLAKGDRRRELVAVEGGTELSVTLTLRGPFKGAALRRYEQAMVVGMAAEAAALKARAEAR